jgi:hypothetical protein
VTSRVSAASGGPAPEGYVADDTGLGLDAPAQMLHVDGLALVLDVIAQLDVMPRVHRA